MAVRREGVGSAGDAAGLVGDAVMSSLADLVERLRDSAPVPAAGAALEAEPVAPAEAGPPRSAHALPTRAAAELLGALVAAIVPVVLSRIDPDVLLDRVDVQRVVDRVDVDEVVRRVDLDDLVSRLDVDALLARVDVDALVRRVDLAAVTREAMEAVDIGEIVRDSTATIGSDVVEGLRSQAMRADDLLARSIDLVVRRGRARRTALDPPRDAR